MFLLYVTKAVNYPHAYDQKIKSPSLSPVE